MHPKSQTLLGCISHVRVFYLLNIFSVDTVYDG